MKQQQEIYDCIVIGGGPGGLTAAEYLGRFLRKTLVIDSGHSRAALIPKTHNYPGFPEGIAGDVLLQKLRMQVRNLGVYFLNDSAIELKKETDGTFIVLTSGFSFKSHTVILATGIVDEKPHIPGLENFIFSGVIRFCPICDGFEAMDKRVGIIGPYSRIYSKARFLRTYTNQIYLFPVGLYDCNKIEGGDLGSLGISVPEKAVQRIIVGDDGVTGIWDDGTQCNADVLYPAMGASVRLDFLKNLQLSVNDNGCVYTDNHQRTDVENLYAIGDITLDLSQISVAIGQAAIAATSIHNTLPLNCRTS
ncbi:MAG TPA: NAD(P)/FAD-dependent oxidoreductase [Micavibrio sp.]|nr:NAD(P)/FAD-dependent oxidoreductase [Micavibrio sp.]